MTKLVTLLDLKEFVEDLKVGETFNMKMPTGKTITLKVAEITGADA